MSTNKEDPYHCYCFKIDDLYLDEFREELEKIEFKDTIWQEEHGQEYGLKLRIDEYTQLHLKVFDNGQIEAEMEYPPDYPAAHLNQIHSYAAHNQLKEIFKVVRIRHGTKLFPPKACLQPKVIPAINPTHVVGFVIAGVAVVSILVVLHALSKSKKG